MSGNKKTKNLEVLSLDGDTSGRIRALIRRAAPAPN